MLFKSYFKNDNVNLYTIDKKNINKSIHELKIKQNRILILLITLILSLIAIVILFI